MPSLIAEARAYRARILAADTETSQRLVSSYAQVVRRIDGELATITRRIEQAEARGQAAVSLLYREARLTALREQAIAELGRFGERAQAVIGSATIEAARLGRQGGVALVDTATPPAVRINPPLLPAGTVEASVAAFRTTALQGLGAQFGPAGAAALEEELVTGLALGHHPSVVARQVRDRLGAPLVRALTISRTEMMRAHREGALESYRANASVVRGWVWIAGLGSRTCAACVAMHGTEHALDEPMESHPRCRCAAAPLTRSWSDLGFQGPEPDPITTGLEWFPRQSERVQRAVLGPGKYRAWKSGQITLPDLVARRHSPVWGNTIREASLSDARQRRRLAA